MFWAFLCQKSASELRKSEIRTYSDFPIKLGTPASNSRDVYIDLYGKLCHFVVPATSESQACVTAVIKIENSYSNWPICAQDNHRPPTDCCVGLIDTCCMIIETSAWVGAKWYFLRKKDLCQETNLSERFFWHNFVAYPSKFYSV